MPEILSGIVYLEDKLGVTSGYERIWQLLIASARLTGVNIWRFSIYKRYPQFNWLQHHGSRKAPTWKPDTLAAMRTAVSDYIVSRQPALVICADPATIGLLGLNADMATLDKLRGGVYHPKIGLDVPWVITLPISAWHSKIKEKDLAAVNKGFTDKDSYIEAYSTISIEDDSSDSPDSDDDHGSDSLGGSGEDSGGVVSVEELSDRDAHELYYEPIVVPYGRFVLTADMKKAGRLLRRATSAAHDSST